jgi:glycosyltransferase involved in cell wall biosynthesis
MPIETQYFSVSEELNLAEILRAVDVLVVPSLGDNSPSVIPEAQMVGTKVIGSNIGGIPEMLSHDQKLLFDPRSPASILEKIRLNSGSYLRSDIANRASTKYSFETIGQKYREHYQNITYRQKNV